MKREEEIANASTVYSEYEYNQIDFKNGFFTGAKWADENPKLHWISVDDDLPCNHKELLSNNSETNFVVAIVNFGIENKFEFVRMYKKSNIWTWWTNGEVLYWLLIPEPPRIGE